MNFSKYMNEIHILNPESTAIKQFYRKVIKNTLVKIKLN